MGAPHLVQGIAELVGVLREDGRIGAATGRPDFDAVEGQAFHLDARHTEVGGGRVVNLVSGKAGEVHARLIQHGGRHGAQVGKGEGVVGRFKTQVADGAGGGTGVRVKTIQLGEIAADRKLVVAAVVVKTRVVLVSANLAGGDHSYKLHDRECRRSLRPWGCPATRNYSGSRWANRDRDRH